MHAGRCRAALAVAVLLTLSAFGCAGRASDAAQPAVPDLDPRKRISTRVLQEVESAESAVTGCGDEWADMVWATAP